MFWNLEVGRLLKENMELNDVSAEQLLDPMDDHKWNQ